MFGELALWHYKRGIARAAIGRTREAEQDLRQSVSSAARPWVHARARLELGKLLLPGDRAAARQELQSAATSGDAANDKATADEARRLLRGLSR